MFVISSALTYLRFHTSRYVITHDSVLPVLHAAYMPHYCDYVMVAVHSMPYTGWATTNLCN